MPVIVTHAKVSGKPAGGDLNRVYGTHWDANHTITGLNTATDAAEGLIELATDAETKTGTETVRAITPANLTAAAVKQGKRTIWVPVSQAIIVSGPSSGNINVNGAYAEYVAFDATASEYIYLVMGMPKSWDEGTITFRARWAHPATTVNFGVDWYLGASSFSNDDAFDNTYASGNIVDTGGTTNDIYLSDESSAITISGSPAPQDLIAFFISRYPPGGSDTMAVDAYLFGVDIYYNTNSATDA